MAELGFASIVVCRAEVCGDVCGQTWREGKRQEEGGIRGSSKHDLGCTNEALEKRRELS